MRRTKVELSVRLRALRDGRTSDGPALDPFDPGVVADPYAWYRELQAGGGVHRWPLRDLWILSRFDDVRAAARSPDALSSSEGVAESRVGLPMMLTLDRPQHTRLRRIVSREFGPAAVARRRPRIEELADEAVNRMLASGSLDAVDGLAAPLPVAVIADVLGVPRADLPRFRLWSDRIVAGFQVGGRRGQPWLRTTAHVFRALRALDRYFATALAERRLEPGDDVLSRLLTSSDQGRLSDEELFWFALLLLVAGNETTTSLIGTMLLTFAERPGQYARLREEPGLVPAAVEEALRFHSPIQGFYRTAREDFETSGGVIGTGSRVLLLYGAANRDPTHFSEPDRFLVDRNPSDHLAFGSGIHHCLGAQLARLEAAVVLETFVARVRSIELSGEPRWMANPSLRGLERLPLRLSAA